MAKNKIPSPLFDSIESLKKQNGSPQLTDAQNKDFQKACEFLLMYKNNEMTFVAYRREIERLMQWCHLKSNKTLKQLKRDDIDQYIRFCQKPLKSWIGLKKVSRFIKKNGERIANKEWKPFVVTLPKAQTHKGKKPDIENYTLSEKSLREIFTITGSFFNFLIQENYTEINPVFQIRQRNQYFSKQQTKRVIRKLPELQWGYVIETAHLMAEENPSHERTLFIMNALYAMYLRISELAASTRWAPQMGHFYRDNDGLWWFKTRGKGNKERHVAVSADMLNALKRFRKHLKLTSLPSPGETTPLISKQTGTGPMTSTRPIRSLIQECFDRSVVRLKEDGFKDDAQQLMHATVHWLRHTGISDDVKIRPREHVRDDAGHSNSSITDKYIDVDLRDRNDTAKKKKIVPVGFDGTEKG
ncbi:MAG: integrase [Gammaproteobacteria bacterium RIFCSPHIGHO2_12_FULL_42_10]|nr:MAG: integrase [Gammaproteobacteria bacterium RIFCSPHIGHO2_12_FULL_42_10]